MSKKRRKEFFGDLISDDYSELSEIHGGLSRIKGHLTHIDEMSDTEARGFYLGRTGRKIPFFALKAGNQIGIGCSYAHAADALMFQQMHKIPVDQRISDFVKTHKSHELYTVENLWDWHRKLTFSCYSGGEEFRDSHGLKMDTIMSVQHFILITENYFGGEIIRQLKPHYFSEEDEQTLEAFPV